MPPWILRWGITTVATIVVILIIGSSIFKYPDTITSTITLTSSKPAANIVAKTSGKLQELYVEDNQTVQTGDYLAVIENPANTADIQYLKKFLQTYKSCPGFDRFVAYEGDEPRELSVVVFFLLLDIISIYSVQTDWVLPR